MPKVYMLPYIGVSREVKTVLPILMSFVVTSFFYIPLKKQVTKVVTDDK